MKHTKGPWEQNPYSQFCIQADGRQIAEVTRLTDRRNYPLADENSANIKLIAAAPELLAALQAVDTDGCDPLGVCVQIGAGDVLIPSHVWDLIEQAITKATD